MTSAYVRLRGLPFTSTDQDIAQWFQSAPSGPLQVIRVLFTYNGAGRKSGESFVELPDISSAERAVQVLNHCNLGNRYIEVFMSNEAEAQAGVSSNVYHWESNGPGSHGICRLRGLPFNTTAEVLMQFFQGYEIPKGVGGVFMVVGANGRPNGEAFVEFGSEEVADAALAKDHATIGTRYVEVFRSTPEQMTVALSRAGKSNNLAPMTMQHSGLQGGVPFAGYGTFSMTPLTQAYSAANPSLVAPGTDAVIKMRGLPYKVTRNNVLEFFGGLSVPLNGVHLMFNEREQPTGEAYVEFSSPDDRERAMAKDRQHIGGRYVELFRVNRAAMIQALEQFVGGYMSNNMQMQGGVAGAAPFATMYGALQQPYGGQPPFIDGTGYASMQVPPSDLHPGSVPNGGVGSPGAGGKLGTLRMRGLPYRATTEDVCRFFGGFQLMAGGVLLGQRDGRATGECWVTFASPQEAARAMVMNNKHMGNRYVEIVVV